MNNKIIPLPGRFAFLLLLIFGFTSLFGQVTTKSSDTILKAAYEQAGRENKNVFVIFQASWCGWCHRMDSIMNDPGCKNLFSSNYVIKHLVVLESPAKKKLENPGAMELMIKYHGDKQGIPYWLIFNKNGKLVADSQKRHEGDGFHEPGEIPAARQLQRK